MKKRKDIFKYKSYAHFDNRKAIEKVKEYIYNTKKIKEHSFLPFILDIHKMEKFDDNCEELMILRWFRDKFVSKEDIEHYYKTAPTIVDVINESENNNEIFNFIYENVVSACVNAIKSGNYEFAYNRYKNSVLALEEQFARPALEKRLVKSLKLGI